jgi:hypothetical protein
MRYVLCHIWFPDYNRYLITQILNVKKNEVFLFFISKEVLKGVIVYRQAMYKKSLKIPKRWSESVNRRGTASTMAKRQRTTRYILSFKELRVACIPSLLWFIISHYVSTIVYLLYFDSSSLTMCPRLYTFFTLIHHLPLCVHDCIPSLLWFIISHYVSTIVYLLYFDSSSPTMCPRLRCRSDINPWMVSCIKLC